MQEILLGLLVVALGIFSIIFLKAGGASMGGKLLLLPALLFGGFIVGGTVIIIIFQSPLLQGLILAMVAGILWILFDEYRIKRAQDKATEKPGDAEAARAKRQQMIAEQKATTASFIGKNKKWILLLAVLLVAVAGGIGMYSYNAGGPYRALEQAIDEGTFSWETTDSAMLSVDQKAHKVITDKLTEFRRNNEPERALRLISNLPPEDAYGNDYMTVHRPGVSVSYEKWLEAAAEEQGEALSSEQAAALIEDSKKLEKIRIYQVGEFLLMIDRNFGEKMYAASAEAGSDWIGIGSRANSSYIAQ